MNKKTGIIFTTTLFFMLSGFFVNEDVKAAILLPDRLPTNVVLKVNEMITSPRGTYMLFMQDDGNLLEYRTRDGAVIWSSQTGGRVISNSYTATIQSEDYSFDYHGNLGVVSAASTYRKGISFNLQAEGNLWVIPGITFVWDSMDYINQISAPPEAVSMGQVIVNYAETSIGIPYEYGGTTPDGYDCSGFTQAVYKHFGIEINRTTYDQINSGVAVSENSLKPGDLIFPTRDTSHVQIYIGNGQIIESPHTGATVRISDLGKFYAARRIINQ